MSGGLHHLSLAGNDLSSLHPQILANGIVRLSNVSTFSTYFAFSLIHLFQATQPTSLVVASHPSKSQSYASQTSASPVSTSPQIASRR